MPSDLYYTLNAECKIMNSTQGCAISHITATTITTTATTTTAATTTTSTTTTTMITTTTIITMTIRTTAAAAAAAAAAATNSTTNHNTYGCKMYEIHIFKLQAKVRINKGRTITVM